MLATAVIAACVIAVTVSLDPGRGRRVGPLELAALVAAVAALAVLLSGAVDADELAAGGASPAVLLLLPGLVAFAAAVAAARLLPVVGRSAARRGRGSGTRLAGVSLARSPGAAGIAVAFLALAIALAGLAEAYRSTLATGERDQAAFAVPTDVVVREDLRSLVPCFEAAPLERYASLPGVEAVHPVTRLSASAGPAAVGLRGDRARRPTGRASLVAALAGRMGRDAATASRSSIATDGPTELRGARAARLGARARGRPGLLAYRAIVEQPDGRFRTLELGSADARQPRVLRGRLPQAARGGRLVALELVAPRLVDRGADAGIALRGTTTPPHPRVSLDGWIGEGGVDVSGATSDTGTIGIDYAVTAQRRARVRPRQPNDGNPPAAAVTPALGELAGGVGGIAAAADRRRDGRRPGRGRRRADPGHHRETRSSPTRAR